MTTCGQNREQLGPYFDGELSPEHASAIAAHLPDCRACQGELEHLKLLAATLSRPAVHQVPAELWPSIERRLDVVHHRQPSRILRLAGLRPRLRLATAAAVVLAAGLTFLAVLSREPRAAAADINFAVLLDGLPLDARQAFAKFAAQHGAKPSTPEDARRFASTLNFATPNELPGGFRLQEVLTLHVGRYPGVAARYQRNGEFLAAIFHPSTCREQLGAHKPCPCVSGQHCGHKVQVGDWKLVHMTDPTTCHCVLSQLDEQRELPAVISVLAAGSKPTVEADPRSKTEAHP